eukprot:5055587-Prymnesium_polylepis.1
MARCAAGAVGAQHGDPHGAARRLLECARVKEAHLVGEPHAERVPAADAQLGRQRRRELHAQ